MNKYTYNKVIQQNYGQGWEDVSEYQTNSTYTNLKGSGKYRTLKSGRKIEISLLKHDLEEYKLLGYPTRVINRKTSNVVSTR